MRYSICYATTLRRVWAGWRQAFEKLLGDADGRIVRIGERGAEIAGERKRCELEIERYGTCMGGDENQGNGADPLEERRR